MPRRCSSEHQGEIGLPKADNDNGHDNALVAISGYGIYTQRMIKAGKLDRKLHLHTVHDMLPYFAASGHSLYAKSAYLYKYADFA